MGGDKASARGGGSGLPRQPPDGCTRDGLRWKGSAAAPGRALWVLSEEVRTQSSFSCLVKKGSVRLRSALLASHGNPQPRARGSSVLRLLLPTGTGFPPRWFSEEQICPDRTEPAFPELPERYKPGEQSTAALQQTQAGHRRRDYLHRSH